MCGVGYEPKTHHHHQGSDAGGAILQRYRIHELIIFMNSNPLHGKTHHDQSSLLQKLTTSFFDQRRLSTQKKRVVPAFFISALNRSQSREGKNSKPKQTDCKHRTRQMTCDPTSRALPELQPMQHSSLKHVDAKHQNKRSQNETPPASAQATRATIPQARLAKPTSI